MSKLFLGFLLLIPLFSGAAEPAPQAPAQEKTAAPRVPEKSVPKLPERSKTHSFTVVLEPLHMTTIFSEITTPVLKINKWMGESFQQDEILMELDKRIYEGNYAKATAAVTKFKTELAAKKQLFSDDALSQFELDDAVASLASAEAEVLIAKKYLDGAEIRAPYSGRVVKIAVKEYELAIQGKELITLVDDDFLYAKFLAPSTLVNCIIIDMPLEIRIKETGNKINATISRIAPVIDPSSSTIVMEAKIDNRDKKLWAGMTGWVSLTECEQHLYKRAP